MKIVITGSSGVLGRALCRELGERDGHEIVAAEGPGWEVTDDDGFLAKILGTAPDLVIHADGGPSFDACETDRDAAFRFNEEGARNVALACKVAGVRLVMVSTDHVFSGEPPRTPWAWGEGDIPRPRTVYGLSRFAGEQMVQMICPDQAVILRVGGLYGAGPGGTVHEMLAAGAVADAEPLRVANDRFFNPTSTQTVADVIRFLLTRPDVSGVVHATCEDQCTPYDFACELKRLLGARFPRELEPCATEDRRASAPVPRHVALKKSVLNILGYRTPNWRVALEAFVRAGDAE